MPDWKQEIRARLGGAGLSPGREADIVEELSQHLADRYHELQNSGLGEEEAYGAARAEISEHDLIQKLRQVERAASDPVVPGAGGGSLLGGLWQDLRYATRLLRLNPGFTAVAVLSLALGIGANTAIFQVLDAVRMRLLPVRSPQELALVKLTSTNRSGSFSGRLAFLTNAQWELIRDRQQAFSGVLAMSNTTVNLNSGGEVRLAHGLLVSGGYFNLLGVPALLGRVLLPADDHRGCGSPALVLGYGFWQREYGGRASVLGSKITMNGQPFEVVGVTPPAFYGLEVGRSFDFAIPLCADPLINSDGNRLTDRRWWWLAVMGRLKPGWSLARATAQLQAISPGIFQETLPDSYGPGDVKNYLGFRLAAYPSANGISDLRRRYESPLWLLLGIAGLVLLIACANLANLLLARASARQRELAVRLALGASRARLLRQLLTESMLLSTLGAALGLALAGILSRFLVAYLGTERLTFYLDLALDWRMLTFTAGLALLTCVVFGLTPALRATRTSPATAMNAAGRGLTPGRERFALRRILVVSQVALSLVLLVGALLFVRTFRNLLTVDAGFQRSGILIADADFTRVGVPPERRMEYKRELLRRVRVLPGVDAAAIVNYVPISGNGWNNTIFIDGQEKGYASLNRVSENFFTTMITPLLAGRDFDNRDTLHSPPVAIVNQAFAAKYLPGANPIGKTFRWGDNPKQAHPLYEIVGLVKNAKYTDLREDFGPIAYFSDTQDDLPDTDNPIVIRSSLPLDSLVALVKSAMVGASPIIDLQFVTMATQVQDSLTRERLLATLSGFFGLLAGLLALIGLYGVISYMVVLRTNEIGIRMALGANRGRIVGMVMNEACLLLAFGLAVGAILSLLAARAAAALLYGLKPHDPITLIASAAILAAAAAAASFLPAQRASRLDPMLALRDE